MKPSIGRIVHYVAYGTPGGEYAAGAHRAAVITQVHSDSCVNLCIINPTGLFFATSALLQDLLPNVNPTAGTWHWPERVE